MIERENGRYASKNESFQDDQEFLGQWNLKFQSDRYKFVQLDDELL